MNAWRVQMCLNECKCFSFRSLHYYSIAKSSNKTFQIMTMSYVNKIYFGAFIILEKLPI